MKKNDIIQLTLLAGLVLIIIFYTQPNKNLSAHNIVESSMAPHDCVDTISQPLDTIKQFFDDYEKRCQLYLDRVCFNGTPITGKLLKSCAKNTYDSTGIIVPLELALSQAQWESGMGLRGRSPKNNPYNIRI